jgi:hypothetical protein
MLQPKTSCLREHRLAGIRQVWLTFSRTHDALTWDQLKEQIYCKHKPFAFSGIGLAVRAYDGR